MNLIPVLFAFLVSLGHQALAAPINLQQSFEKALQHNELFQIQEKSLDIAREQRSQAIGTILPQISGIGTYTKQDVSELTDAQRASVREDAFGARIFGKMTLFKGTQEYAANRAALRNVEANEFELKQARRELFGRVATEFYNLVYAKKDLENIGTLLHLTEQRTAELLRRTKVGRARKGELLQAQAQVAFTRAQLSQAQSVVTQAQTAFFQVTGIRDAELDDATTLPAKLEPLETYLGQLEGRPDIQALQRRTEVADEQVSIAQGAHLPTLDLTGNYYLRRDSSSLDKVRWDYGLVLTVPLFEGGVTQSKVREASASYRQSELNLAYGRKSAERELKDLHKAVAEGVQQLASLTESASLAEANYKEQTKDNRYELVSSLEVLQALNTYIDNRRALNRTSVQVKIAYAKLRAAVGEIN